MIKQPYNQLMLIQFTFQNMFFSASLLLSLATLRQRAE